MKTTDIEAPVSGLGQALAGKYLTFRVDEESYGIAVLRIREIIRITPITAVPQMPSYIKGVINLRGKVIPVVGLRAKFGLPEANSTERTCIVVVQLELANQSKALVGLIVDAVEEVAYVVAQDIEETPNFGSGIDTAYILGMAKVKGCVKSLLDIDRVISGESVSLLKPDR